MNANKPNFSKSPPRPWWRGPLPMESETSWLIFAGLADLVLTVVLLRTGAVREANPIGKLVLKLGGVQGLIWLKCSLLLLVAVAAQLIARRHPRTARAVLLIGLLAQCIAVGCGLWLLVRVVG